LLVFALCGCGRIGFGASAGDGGVVDGVVIGDGVVVTTNVAFVTSTTQPVGSLGGLAGADAVCNARAAEAGLPGTYVAWLATANVRAIDRLAGSRGWVRTDGLPFTDRTSDLIGGAIYYPIDHDEHGQKLASWLVTTNSSGAGDPLGADCAGYTTTTGPSYYGDALDSTELWSHFGMSATGCADPSPLYCFGVGGTTPVVAPTSPTGARRAFLLNYGWSPGNGVASADTACQSAADAAQLGGTFLALLATTTASPISRFSTAGPPWVRLDGVLLADTAADLANENTIATLNVDTLGNYYNNNEVVWNGPSQLNSPGAGAETCASWTSKNKSNTGSTAMAAATGQPGFWTGTKVTCDSPAPGLYCLEP
jgi:hypothetical protein